MVGMVNRVASLIDLSVNGALEVLNNVLRKRVQITAKDGADLGAQLFSYAGPFCDG